MRAEAEVKPSGILPVLVSTRPHEEIDLDAHRRGVGREVQGRVQGDVLDDKGRNSLVRISQLVGRFDGHHQHPGGRVQDGVVDLVVLNPRHVTGANDLAPFSLKRVEIGLRGA